MRIAQATSPTVFCKGMEELWGAIAQVTKYTKYGGTNRPVKKLYNVHATDLNRL